MSINSYLSNLASSLVLSESEKSSITTSINTLESRLDCWFGDDIVKKFVFGSYARGTILPRKADSNSDIDIMVVFSNPDLYQPQTFLNRLKTFVEYYYSTSIVYQSSPTIVLELNHIKFELTPAYCLSGLYYIPNGPTKWMFTDPDGFYKTLTECNANNGYKIKPIVRLIKHWNIQKNYRNLASYSLEKRIAEDMKYSYALCSSYVEYVRRALEAIKPLSDYSRINAAISHIDKAIEYENDSRPYSALEEIKKVFPEV